MVATTPVEGHLTVSRLKFALDMTDSRVVDDDVGVKRFLRQASFSNADAQGNVEAAGFLLEMVGGWAWYGFGVSEKVGEVGIGVIGDPRAIDGKFREGY